MKSIESLSGDRIGEGEDSIIDRNTKKVQFKDGGDGCLANMVVDSASVSGVLWKDKLLGGSISNSLGDATNLDLVFEDGDILRSNINGIPAIDFSGRINKILVKEMVSIVMVKLLGCDIGYGVLHNRPWIVFGHYLIVQPWTVDFDSSRPFPCDVLAWIHFLGLSGFLYQKKILDEIASLVGKVVKLDIKTNSGQRGQFSRMVVFVDLEKPLTSQVLINGRLQCVEFEALPEISFSCGKYGYLKSLCLFSLTDRNSHGGEENSKSSLSS
ncbi:hypothetical protein Goshw_007348 [Gossypium schwendimanii]|uniref:DUF4283 domain-containing protein n=1 Tax=Gossypium schwendimanii TaxID=34291 RepID=A0A7J9KJY2_GOSSC|nr:hypothetical protein [Gossypium schwendimanii]